MKALAGVVAVALVVLVGAFVFVPKGMTDAEQAQVEAEVKAVMNAFYDGWREMDMEKVAGLAHPNELIYPYVGQVLDWSGYRDAILAWAEGKAAYKGGWTSTKVRVLSPDLAVFSGTSTDTLTYSDGRIFEYPNNAMAFLLERTSDGWRFSMGGASNAARRAIE
jgi:uncharacterized protein (TIGR02246 family)